ncbi:MAG: hypothetical protein HXS44_04815 [Theionarchaea archaeon]|nr:hypothetical protein [Theionarchaea archaeon]
MYARMLEPASPQIMGPPSCSLGRHPSGICASGGSPAGLCLAGKVL